MATDTQAPTWLQQDPVQQEPDWLRATPPQAELAPVTTPPPVVPMQEPDWMQPTLAPQDANLTDYVSSKWDKVKRYGALLGQGASNVLTDTLPAWAAQEVEEFLVPDREGLQALVDKGVLSGKLREPGPIETAIRDLRTEMFQDVQAGQQEAQQMLNEGRGIIDQSLGSAAYSTGRWLGQFGVGAAAAALTRQPSLLKMAAPSLSTLYIDSMIDKQAQMEALGYEPRTAKEIGKVSGAIETGTEALGVMIGGKLLREGFKKSPELIKGLANFFLADWSGEQVATTLDTMLDAVVTRKEGEDWNTTADRWEKTWKEQMPVSMVAPVFGGAMQVGAMKLTSTAIDQTVGKALRKVEKYYEDRKPGAFVEFPQEVKDAMDAWRLAAEEAKRLQADKERLDQEIQGLPQAASAPPIWLGYGGVPAAGAEIDYWNMPYPHTTGTGLNSVYLSRVEVNETPDGQPLPHGTTAASLFDSNANVPGVYWGTQHQLEAYYESTVLNARKQVDLWTARLKELEMDPKTTPDQMAAAKEGANERQKYLGGVESNYQLMKDYVDYAREVIPKLQQKYLPNTSVIMTFGRSKQSEQNYGDQISYVNQFGKRMALINLNPDLLLSQVGNQPRQVRQKTGNVYLRADKPTLLNRRQMAETLAHEFGHAIWGELRTTLTPEEQKAVYQAYIDAVMAGAQKNRTKEMKHHMAEPMVSLQLRLAHLAGQHGKPFEPRTGHGGMFPVRTSLSEYFAQLSARKFLQEQGTTPDTLTSVGIRFQKALRRFYRDNRKAWAPNTTFEKFVDRLAVENELRSAEARKQTAQAKYAASLQMMHQNPPQQQLVQNVHQILRGGRGRPPTGMWISAQQQRAIKQATDKYNWFIRWTASLLDLADLNPWIPGFLHSFKENGESYVDAVRKQHRISLEWKEKGVEVAKDILDVVHRNEKTRLGFNGFIFEADALSDKLGRKLTPDELELLRQKYNIEAQDVAVADKAWSYLTAAITEVETLRAQQLQNAFVNGTVTQQEFQQEMLRLRKDFAELKNRNYFPHTRFGKYFIHVVSMKKNMQVNPYYTAKRIGSTVSFEAFMNKRDLAKRVKELQAQYGNDVRIHTQHVEDDTVAMMLGFDTRLAKHVIDGMNLTADQKKVAEEMLLKLNPTEGFRKKLLKRKNIPGYTDSAARVFGDYSARFANFISRLQTRDSMDAAIQEMEHSALDLGRGAPGLPPQPLAGVKRTEITNWVKRHRDYLMNPGNELAGLRAAGFMWYLSLVPKAALVNLTQVPMVAYPYLASQYSDLAATRELTVALKDMVKQFSKGTGYNAEEYDMLEKLGGLIDESFASMLGALQEGSILEKVTKGRFVGRERTALKIQQAQEWANFMFSAAEKLNRRVVGLATYRLARKAGDSHDVAIVKARTAIEKTQFEYAHFNRPQLMRGKKSAFFLFQQYVTSMLYFLGRSGEGRARYLMLALLLGGIQGFPGSENIFDLVDWFVTKFKEQFGFKNPKLQIRAELREFINDLLEENPWIPGETDIYMKGLASNVFGVDITGSIGLSKFLPGTDVMNRQNMSPLAKAGTALGQAAGPLANIPISMLMAWGSNDPNIWKRWEKAMPVFAANISKAARYAVQGMETDPQGDPLAMFDINNPEHLKEIAQTAAGFQLHRLKERREMEWMARESIAYYKAQAATLMREIDRLVVAQDPELHSKIGEMIRDYNERVPHPSMKIGPGVAKSIKARATRRALKERGFGGEKKYANYYQEFIANLDPSTEEESTTGQ